MLHSSLPTLALMLPLPSGQTAEDLEDAPSLGALYRIMRGAIMLNDAPLLEELLREEAVMDVMGCLEYDPDLPGPQGHRAFLQHNVVFKEVVPIASAEVGRACAGAVAEWADV
jgi:protein phosphatase-4 regulatory subunit 3